MKPSFSGLQRSALLKDMASEPFDLLVIGGGITGCGIALDAQVRGINTALIDMQDFAEGTSSRSTKLVHGGLRYLKQFEVKLVAEVGKERSIVYENAPHVTTPIGMLLPIYENGTFGKMTTSVGLKVYDFLARVKKQERRRILTRDETLKKEPLLKKDGLKGSGHYVEYRTDDARLTIEVLKEAVARGVKAINYVKAEDLLYDEYGVIIGVRAVDQLSGESIDIYAEKVVNAAGPWVDTIREMDHSKEGKTLHLTKGVHLVVDGSRFPLKNAVYFDTPNEDGRMIFAIPRGDKVYFGTTDTNFQGDPVSLKMSTPDRDYLLEAVNGVFPGLQLTVDDVESSWVGVRPLIHAEGKTPSEISRKDEIFISTSNLISIAGGKLSGYRKMAERVVDVIAEQLEEDTGKKYLGCSTEVVALSGGSVGGINGFPDYIKSRTSEGATLGLAEEEAESLVRLYGSNVERLYGIIRESSAEAGHHGLSVPVYAQLKYGMEEEMVMKPVDFFIRRTGALYFNIDWVKEWMEPVVCYMQKQFQWDDSTAESYRDQLEKALEDAVNV